MAILQHNPTFLLREIDPEAVVAQYLSGRFTYPTSKITIGTTQVNLIDPTYDSDPQNGIYTVKDKSNNKLVMATTNHSNYDLYRKNGEKMPIGGKCDVCDREFTTQSLGIVLHMSRFSMIDENGVFHPKTEVWMDGCMDSLECVLYATRVELSKMVQYRTCSDASERYVHALYLIMHPNSKSILSPCKDPRLLISKGGSLTYEQWSNDRHEYQETGHLITIPVKREWLRHQYGPSTYVVPDREPMISR